MLARVRALQRDGLRRRQADNAGDYLVPVGAHFPFRATRSTIWMKFLGVDNFDEGED